jgi:hypothetical protein
MAVLNGSVVQFLEFGRLTLTCRTCVFPVVHQHQPDGDDVHAGSEYGWLYLQALGRRGLDTGPPLKDASGEYKRKQRGSHRCWIITPVRRRCPGPLAAPESARRAR